MVERGTAARQTARAVRHDPATLRGADLRAEVRLRVATELALAALGDVERDDVVPWGGERGRGGSVSAGHRQRIDTRTIVLHMAMARNEVLIYQNFIISHFNY